MITTVYLPIAWKVPQAEQLTGVKNEELDRIRSSHATDQQRELDGLLNEGWAIIYHGPTEDRNGHYAVFVLYKPDEA